MTPPGQSDTSYGSEPVALLDARESWLIYRAIGPHGEAPPTEADRQVYMKAVEKLKAAAQEASP
jgi:hypothetical protein